METGNLDFKPLFLSKYTSNAAIVCIQTLLNAKNIESKDFDSVTLPGDSSKQTLLTYLIDCWIKI